MTGRPKPLLGIKIAVAVATLIVFGMCTYLRDTDFAAVVTFSVLALTAAVYSSWELRSRTFFWPALILVAAAHILFVTRFNGVLPKPTILVAPVVIIDFVAIVSLLYGLDKLLARATDRR